MRNHFCIQLQILLNSDALTNKTRYSIRIIIMQTEMWLYPCAIDAVKCLSTGWRPQKRSFQIRLFFGMTCTDESFIIRSEWVNIDFQICRKKLWVLNINPKYWPFDGLFFKTVGLNSLVKWKPVQLSCVARRQPMTSDLFGPSCECVMRFCWNRGSFFLLSLVCDCLSHHVSVELWSCLTGRKKMLISGQTSFFIWAYACIK